MRIRVPALAATALAAALSIPSAPAAAVIGQPAPEVSLPDTSGATQRLSAFKGRFVVLEWVNFECPFVGKHYGSGNMQKLQKAYTQKGVVWLSICSSAQGKQGYVTGQEANTLVEAKGAAPTRFLLDPKGSAGKAYGAKTTPHMFVIDPKGTLIYNGAIDDKPSTNKDDVPTAKNYVAAALDESMAGEKVAMSATQPYGCSVKY